MTGKRTPRLDPAGAGHRILQTLRDGEAITSECLRARCGVTEDRTRKHWYRVGALVSEGLLIYQARHKMVEVTQKGLAALARLDAGERVPLLATRREDAA